LFVPVQATLGLFAFTIPFDTGVLLVRGSSDAGTTLSWYLGAFTGITLLGVGFQKRRFVAPPRCAVCWTLFVVFAGLTTVWAVDPVVAWSYIPTIATLLLLYVVAVSFSVTPRERSALNWMTMLGGVVAAACAIYSFEHGVQWGGRASLVINGKETNPNIMAASFILPMALALQGLSVAQSWWRRTVMGGSFILTGYCQFLAMSRGALLAAAVMILVLLYRNHLDRRIVAVVVILAFALLVAPKLLFQRVDESVSSSAAGRFDVWRAGISVAEDYIWQGAGLDNFRVVYQQHAGTARVFRGYNREAHNTFLRVAAEFGIVGMALLVLALVYQLRLAKQIAVSSASAMGFQAGYAYEAAIWGLLTAALALDVLWLKLFWITLILSSMPPVREPSGAASSPSEIPSRNPRHRGFQRQGLVLR
jgi:O-antigen ligase